MIEVKTTDRGTSSRFIFPPEFLGFQGHFPEKKVLPGACQIQCALTTIEHASKKAVGLKEVMLAKYFAPVFPQEEMMCSVSEMHDETNEMTYKVIITKGSVKVAEMKLRVTLKAGKKRSRNA